MLETKAENLHTPVLLKETLQFLAPGIGELLIDATLGLGGHTEAILQTTVKTKVIGIDQDNAAIEFARVRLDGFGERVKIFHANFRDVKQVLENANASRVDGIIADLGVSSLQFDSEIRGFSFRFDAPLDMRMNPESDMPTAAEILRELPEPEIANLIYLYGEERFSRRIARRIVERRESGEPVETTRQLVELVERSVKRSPKDKIHPATRTFQALRIAVNHELDVLVQFITDAVDILKKGGRLVIITFHSLEDRIVKNAFRKLSGQCFCPPRIPQCVCGAAKMVEILTRKPVVPSEAEVEQNFRSRSAKLRAVRKIVG